MYTSVFTAQGVREVNEDALYPEPGQPAGDLFIVADGLGGHADGLAASRLACRTVREILEDVLTANGFRVISAEDGYEALVRVRDARPDLIFLDLLMPRMDGYEVCRRLKRDDATRTIPVVMLTVKELQEDHGAGFREGADLYIEKPFTEKKILAIVENVLGLE